jgi:hypothetical protein
MISSIAARADASPVTAMSCGHRNISGVACARGGPTNSARSPSRPERRQHRRRADRGHHVRDQREVRHLLDGDAGQHLVPPPGRVGLPAVRPSSGPVRTRS